MYTAVIVALQVVAYNRTTSKVDDFLNNEVNVTSSKIYDIMLLFFQAKGTNVVGAHSLEEMVGKLKRPRRVMILVKVLTFVHCSQTKNFKTY